MRKNSWTIALFAIFVIALAGFVSCGEDDAGKSSSNTKKTAVINIAAIPGITNPAIGGGGDTNVETAQYTGTVQWRVGASGNQNLEGTFAAATVYRAIITLTAKAGFTLTGVSENFFTVNGIRGTNAASSGIVTVLFPVTPPQPVDVTDFEISGVVKPIAGVPPAQIDNTGNTQYTGEIEWMKADDTAVGETFNQDTSYKAIITLTRTGNYVFTAITSGADKFTLEGIASEDIVSITNSEGTATEITVNIVFKATDAPLPVDIAAIATVTTPEVGVTDASNIDTAQYTGTIEWDPELIENKFFGETTYKATMALTIKPGLNYTFANLANNFFNVGGVPVTIKTAGTISIVVEATFPATNPLVLSELEIEGIDPVGYEEPVTTLSADHYTIGITWKNAGGDPAGEYFTEGTEYTATVTLTAKNGFAFDAAITAEDITFASAHDPEDIEIIITEKNAKQLIFTVAFPATAAPEVIDIFAITGIQVPSTTNRPVTEITPAKKAGDDAEEQFTGTVTWSPAPLNGAFQAGETYTATITLTVSHHYSFRDVTTTNKFTVDGASATNSTVSDPREHELVVTAVFPVTPACTNKNCVDGKGCVVHGLTVDAGYPFHGATSIGIEQEQQLIRTAPVYSSLIITFGAYHDLAESPSVTASMGRIGEGDARIAFPGFQVSSSNNTRNNPFVIPVTEIWKVMDDQSSTNSNNIGERFSINTWRAYIEYVALHIPEEDPRPKCPVCGEHGCEDHCLYCEKIKGTGVDQCDGLCGTVVNWPHTSQPWSLQAYLNSGRTWTTPTISGYTTMKRVGSSGSDFGPIHANSGTEGNILLAFDDTLPVNERSLYVVVGSGNQFHLIIGTSSSNRGLSLKTKDNDYTMRITGTTITTSARLDIRYDGWDSTDILGQTVYTGNFDVLVNLPRTTADPAATGDRIRFGFNASTVRIDKIEIINRSLQPTP